jgi:HNH endonuclease
MARPWQVHTVEARFWRLVHKGEGCWEWIGGRMWNGYGRFVLDQEAGKNTRAHRFAWELANGPVPAGRVVCHSCDNRACVRLDHLWLGTQADNLRDMREKGRGYSPPKRATCVAGHELTPENTYVRPNRERACRECRRVVKRAWRARRCAK